MGHKRLEDGRCLVDWTTGDPEGDRITLLNAYRDFISKVIDISKAEGSEAIYGTDKLDALIKEWGVSIDNQIDEVPRIWIKRPTE